MGKPHQTVEYVKSRRPDGVQLAIPDGEIPPGRTPIGRLNWRFLSNSLRIDDETFARQITDYALPDAQFVLDTCFLTGADLDVRVWRALRSRTILISPLVWSELQPWIENPFRNQAIRDDIVTARANCDPLIQFLPTIDLEKPTDLGIAYYIQLLAFRKEVFAVFEDILKKRLGREPTEDELVAHVRRIVQDRGMQLAIKGRADFDKPTFMADEATVVRAVAAALATGRETTILTRDTDLPEQFYKFLYILDTHYRSSLLAAAYRQQPLNFRVQDVPGERALPGFHKDGAKLVHLPVGASERALPVETTSVILYCTCLGDSASPWTFDNMTFNADSQMFSLFALKGRTRGLNSDLFGEMNFHRCVNPHATDVFGKCSIVAKDLFPFERDEMRWAAVDVELALRRIERGSRVHYVEH